MHVGLTLKQYAMYLVCFTSCGPTHVSANKDNKELVYIYLFIRYRKSIDSSTQALPGAKCRTSNVGNMVCLLFHAAASEACKVSSP